MLFSNRDYEAGSNMTLFSNMQFKLMEVVPMVGKIYVANKQDGKPVFHDPNSPDYLRQVGRNTGATYHPEEILANNFATCMTSRGTVTGKVEAS